MSYKKLLYICFFLALLPAMGQAQTGEISGTVKDAATGDGLAGANVLVRGENIGAATSLEGDYTITNVPAGAQTLEVRYLGYQAKTLSVEVTAGEVLNVDIDLAQSQLNMDEVVITGTAGDTRRRAVGNSISRVDASDIMERVSNNTVTELLQAKVPGMTLVPGSGTAGTAANIRIRGAGSMQASVQPIFYVDGVRIQTGGQGNFNVYGQNTSALDAINPNDIASIEVIKGPAAATIYGANAASGVINITTKQGSMGEPNINWSARVERGGTSWPESWRPTNYSLVTEERLDAPDNWPGMVGMQAGEFFEHIPMSENSDALRTGVLNQYSLSVRGGGQQYSFFVSGSRDEEDGVFYNNYSNRSSVRGNFRFFPSEQLDFSVNAGYSNNHVRLPLNDNIAYGLIISSWLAVPGRQYTGAGDVGFFTIAPEYANTYNNQTRSDRFSISSTINYRPLDWFTNRLRVGIDSNTRQAELFYTPDQTGLAPFGVNVADGYVSIATPKTDVYTIDYGGSLQFDLNQQIRSDFSFGFQFEAVDGRSATATGEGLGSEAARLVGNAATTFGSQSFSESRSFGVYVQEQIGWEDRLFATAAVRMDNNSVFGSEINRVFYPKTSLSYVMSEAPFFNYRYVDEFRLRAAWGQAGNAPGTYAASRTYTTSVRTMEDGSAEPALRYATFGNPDLVAERSSELELGFDLSMFMDRLGLEITYYNTVTRDAIMSVSVAPSTGFSGSTLENLGEIKNTGIEAVLSFVPLALNSVNWRNTFTFSTNSNELVSFGDGRDSQIFGIYHPVQRYEEGKPLGAFWAQRASRDDDGVMRLESEDIYKGPSLPTRELKYSAEINFLGGFRFFALVDYQGGHYQFNVKDMRRDRARISWETVNPEADPDEVAARALWGQTYHHVQPADFIKLRDVSLSYTLPVSFVDQIGLNRATLSVTGHNLAVLWTRYGGHDPEVNFHGDASFSRVDSWTAPNFRRITGSLSIDF
ncbi:SusC/RagA family TonB-linked outer membrane protein [Natronogracilivirga saccharolytica]|uniref:SusC/RagA family TonB-linked outer membrane protein n=1 Tax=Natronogracilivirga saccharolytica TaxID=2812953 RepID=A0A8J7RP62_9BACT|nr:SusC/RagA family TonB-linked outer membrane protein [Natronogracilivirga saccharolytica]MBP3191309.1 SusC/RagA family TonB-linked outer membrane protein [Natronogracilivirga saccharolytica]